MKKPFIMYGAVDETTFKEILEIFPEAEEKIRKGIYFQKDKPKLAMALCRKNYGRNYP